MNTNDNNGDSNLPSTCKNTSTVGHSRPVEKESSSSKRKATKLLNIKSSSLNILCKICGDKSSGFHYGVHACEGCKGFFRRTVRMKLEYDVCDQMCKVDLKNRNRCQYCRYKKCIDQGMSHDAIRFGRMPRVEKERIIADTVDLANSSAVGSAADPDKNVRIFCLIESLSSSFLKHCSMTREKVTRVWISRKALGDEAKSLRHLGDVLKTYPQINEEMKNIASSSVPGRKEMNADGNTSSSSSLEGASGNSPMSTDYDSKDVSTPTSASSPESNEASRSNFASATNVNFLTSSLPDLKLSARNRMLNKQEPDMSDRQSSTNFGAEHPTPSPNFNPGSNFGPGANFVPGIPGIDMYRFILNRPEAKNFIDASKFGNSAPGTAFENNPKQFPPHAADLRNHAKKDEKSATNMSGAQLLRQRLAQVLYLRMQKRLVIGIGELCEFAKQIPQFLNLDITDQVVLLKYGSYEAVFVMMGSLVFDKGILLPLTNLYVSFEFIEELEVAGDVMRSKLKFAEKVAALQLNDVELALFVAVILVSPDRPGLINSSKVETIQEEILESLKVQLSLCHPNKPRLFGQLLLLLTELRQLVTEHVVMVERLNKIQEIAPPLIQEILTGFE